MHPLSRIRCAGRSHGEGSRILDGRIDSGHLRLLKLFHAYKGLPRIVAAKNVSRRHTARCRASFLSRCSSTRKSEVGEHDEVGPKGEDDTGRYQ